MCELNGKNSKRFHVLNAARIIFQSDAATHFTFIIIIPSFSLLKCVKTVDAKEMKQSNKLAVSILIRFGSLVQPRLNFILLPYFEKSDSIHEHLIFVRLYIKCISPIAVAASPSINPNYLYIFRRN